MSPPPAQSRLRGFTLVELLVVIAIVTVIVAHNLHDSDGAPPYATGDRPENLRSDTWTTGFVEVEVVADPESGDIASRSDPEWLNDDEVRRVFVGQTVAGERAADGLPVLGDREPALRTRYRPEPGRSP